MIFQTEDVSSALVCPIEEGFCVQSNNGDQDEGQMKLHHIHRFDEESRSKCLLECRQLPGSTGCEMIWNAGNAGCYVHTRPVAKGNGRIDHICWILSKCQGWTNECCVENCTVSRLLMASATKVHQNLVIGFSCAAILLLAGSIIALMSWYQTRSRFAPLLAPNPGWQFDPERSVQEQVGELPYNLLFEFPRLDVTRRKLIGEGNFGEVWEATAEGVAAFRPRDKSELALRSKLSNIYARKRSYNEFWVKYFRQEYYPPPYSEEGRVAVKCLKPGAPREHYKNLAGELKLMIHIGAHKNVVNLMGACTQQGPLWVLLEYCPYGDLQKFLRARTLCPSWSRLDLESPDQICFLDLIRMAMEIAEGMIFLSLSGIVHRDLSARNILVGHNMEMKVADFGMARNVGGIKEEYKKESKAGIPVRWTSPEAMNLGIYSTSSDVWAYGILIWELFSMGQQPYGGMSNFDVKLLVERGERLDAPSNCPDGISMLMKATWNENPKERPDFSEIFEILLEIKRAVFAPSSDYYTGETVSAEANLYINDEFVDCKPLIREQRINWMKSAGMDVNDENVDRHMLRIFGSICSSKHDDEIFSASSLETEELDDVDCFHNKGYVDEDVERKNSEVRIVEREKSCKN